MNNEFSRSEIVTEDLCPTKAYQTYREDGTGYVPAGSYENLTTLRGTAGHKGTELFFNKGENSEWREVIADQFRKLDEPHRTINTTLIRRAVWVWSLDKFPQMNAEWKPLGAEVPFKWQFVPGLFQPLRQDQLFEHRENGSIITYDFKFTGSPDLNWTERKKISKQTHLYIKALKDVLPDKHIAGMVYQCIEIGKWDDKRGIHKSPFVTGWQTKTGKVTPKWAYGYEHADLCVYSDEKWLEWARKSNALEGLIWSTDIILPSDDDLIRTQEATGTQMLDYAVKLARVENSMDKQAEARKLFQRNDEACLKFGWGHVCPHYNRCWKGHQLDLETFEPRKDHHAVEPE